MIDIAGKQIIPAVIKYTTELGQSIATVKSACVEHFCRVFHSITGRSPIDYLNYYRVECAAELLCLSLIHICP